MKAPVPRARPVELAKGCAGLITDAEGQPPIFNGARDLVKEATGRTWKHPCAQHEGHRGTQGFSI